MEVVHHHDFQSPRFRRHAVTIGTASLLVAIAGGLLMTLVPAFTSQAARALVTSHIHMQPNEQGLADISFNQAQTTNKPEQRVGQALDAGSRLHLQWSLEAASK